LNPATVDRDAVSGEDDAMGTFLVTASLYNARLMRCASAIWDVRGFLASIRSS
jgi:hypothetical protein